MSESGIIDVFLFLGPTPADFHYQYAVSQSVSPFGTMRVCDGALARVWLVCARAALLVTRALLAAHCCPSDRLYRC